MTISKKKDINVVLLMCLFPQLKLLSVVRLNLKDAFISVVIPLVTNTFF